MYTFNDIFHYQLMNWLTSGVIIFYVFTAGIGPALLGYCLGRWMPFYVRVIPLLFILWVCVGTGKYSPGHGSEFLAIGNLIYAYFCRRGLKRKAEDRNIAYEDLLHIDWIIVVIATILIPLIQSVLSDW